MAARIKENYISRGDFKTNEFLKPNSLVAFFNIQDSDGCNHITVGHFEKFKMAFRMVARIRRTAIAM